MYCVKTPLTMDSHRWPNMHCDYVKEPEDKECLNCEWHSDCYDYQTCVCCNTRNYDCDWTHDDGIGNPICDECWELYGKDYE